jgi:hypothetical protein
MKVLFSHRVRKKEFKSGHIPPADLKTILEGYAGGISIAIKGEALPKGSRLIKIYATTVRGARRIVFLVDVETGTGFFLFYRSKNDVIGNNISIQNPAFRKTLHQYLDFLSADIATGQLTSYEVP